MTSQLTAILQVAVLRVQDRAGREERRAAGRKELAALLLATLSRLGRESPARHLKGQETAVRSIAEHLGCGVREEQESRVFWREVGELLGRMARLGGRGEELLLCGLPPAVQGRMRELAGPAS